MNNPRVPGRPGLSRGAQPPGRPGRPGPPTPQGRAGRPFRTTPPKLNPLPIVFGALGVLLVVLLIVIMMPGKEKAPEKPVAAPPPPPAAPKPVDVSGLEREGLKAADEGYALIMSLEPKFTATLTDAEKQKLKEDLKKAIDLIQKGMGFLSEANEKAGRTYQTTKYVEARKLASMKYHELK